MQDHLSIAVNQPDDDTLVARFELELMDLPDKIGLDRVTIVDHDESERRSLVEATISMWIDW